MKLLKLLICAVLVMTLSPVWAMDPDQQDQSEPGSETVTDTADSIVEVPDIPLRENLRILIRPTILGLVPPSNPEGFGEVFIRTTAVSDDQIQVHFEIKESWLNETNPDQESIRIRRGTATAEGISNSQGFAPPIFWPNRSFSTDSALLWLSRTSFSLLKTKDRCRFNPRFLMEDDVDNELIPILESYIEESGVEIDSTLVYLEEPRETTYPCIVNGERADLPALMVTDSLDLATYYILDDRENPLVLKMTYHHSLNVPNEENPSYLLEAGAGFAVLELDF